MKKLEVFYDIQSYQRWFKEQQLKTKEEFSIGFVPTMGALHRGHASLLKESRRENQLTVLSIFVNPTQFGPNEDLSKYPRTLEADLEIAKNENVDAVLVPTNEILYPSNFSTYVTEEKISAPLCGIYRPGHFRGVTTIVLKLFNIIQPQKAYFGLKDAQQFFVIHRMVQDLNLPTQVIGLPTVREESGLALSSRNTYLEDHTREIIAPRFFQILQDCQNQFLKTANQKVEPYKIQEILVEGKKSLESAGFEVQYLDLVLDDFSTPTSLIVGRYLLAGAVFIKGKNNSTVRLIDNVIFEIT